MKKIFWILLLIVLSLPSVFPLLNSGFFQSDDGLWMIIRFSAFHEALRDGQFPVRFLGRLNFGFGYPVSNFLYPGFMYLGELIHLFKIDFQTTIKIIFGLSMFGSFVFSYLWLSKLFNKKSAFIGGLFYLYTPYHPYDLYIRGSVGEVLALAVLPFILWQVERKSFAFTSLGLAFLILSHNTLALLFLPLIVVYLLVIKKYLILNTLYIILLAFGLSAFFWIPAIFELSFAKFSQIQVSDYKQYFSSIEIIGFSTIVVFSLSALVLYEICLKKNFLKNSINKLFSFNLILSVFIVFLGSKQSEYFWNFIPVSFIQFPFRLLSYLPFSLSILTAFLIFSSKGKKQIMLVVILLFFLFISAFPFLKPSGFIHEEDSFYTTNEATTTVRDEYLPKWVIEKPKEHFSEKVEILNQKGRITNLLYNSKRIIFDADLLKDSSVRINTIYYPGWESFIDGKQSIINYSNNFGAMDLSIPKGKHQIKLVFSETPFRLFADFISVLSLLLLLFHSRISAKFFL